MKIQIGELSGSESITLETIHDKKDLVTLSEVSKDYSDAKKTSIGIAENNKGEKFLVWKITTVTQNDDANSTTVYVVDALNGELITTFDKVFDNSSKDGKWIHYEFKDKFAELSPEEREAKFTQFNEMKQAFSSISDEDRNLIKSHFNEMKQEFTNLSDEDKVAMHTEFKSQMKEFSSLSLDAKILHLQELTNSLK
jgi:DNA invertase Pin-like site-specific DNA recombinase